MTPMASSKMAVVVALAFAYLAGNADAGCGCLKCSKHLKVVSPPEAPIMVIYKGAKDTCSCPKLLPYSVQIPLAPPNQLPCLQPPPVLLNDLWAVPDRVVMPAPEPALCPNAGFWPVVEPLEIDILPVVPPQKPQLEFSFPPSPWRQPLVLPPPAQVAPPPTCGCRYDAKKLEEKLFLEEPASNLNRKRRDLSSAKTFLSITKLLPSFIRVPLEKTFQVLVEPLMVRKKSTKIPSSRYQNLEKSSWKYQTLKDAVPTKATYPKTPKWKYGQKYEDLVASKPIVIETDWIQNTQTGMTDLEKSIFLQKLRMFNSQDGVIEARKKREVREITLPFFQVTDMGGDDIDEFNYNEENNEEDNEEENEISDEIVGIGHGSNLLKPFHVKHLIPHNPLFYFLNAPIRLIQHLHGLKKHFSPVLRSIPRVLLTSKKYFKNFGKNIHGHLLNIASNLVGDFGGLRGTSGFLNNFMPTGRFRRSANCYGDAKKPEVWFFQKVVVPGRFKRDTNNDDIIKETLRQPDISFLQEMVPPVDNDNKKVVDINVALAGLLDINDKEPDVDLYQHFNEKPFGEEPNENPNENLRKFTKNLDENSDDNNAYTKPNEEPNTKINDRTLMRRSKRFILKVVDEDEVQQFLREKLEGLEGPTSHENPSQISAISSDNKRYKIKPMTSKIIIDNNGRPFVEIDGMKRPIFNRMRKTNQERIVGAPQGSKIRYGRNRKDLFEDQDVKRKITSLIEQAKSMSNQNLGSAPYNSEMHIQILKEKVSQILNDIQRLINYDFSKYMEIQDDLLRLQNLKVSVTREWKNILIENDGRELGNKIRILNAVRDLQANKDVVLAKVANTLRNSHNYMAKKLIKILIRLQKLQCIIFRTVEDFEDKIRMGAELEVPVEIKRIDSLDAITLTTNRNLDEIEDDIRKDRDEELQKQIDLLENLRRLLEIRASTDNQDTISKINEAARLIWEGKNINRLQKDSIVALNEKLTRCQKLRKELKILFDLQKQLEGVEAKQDDIVQEILTGKRRSQNVTRQKRVKSANLKSTNQKSPNLKSANQKQSFRINNEQLKPVKLLSNGRVVNGFKLPDNYERRRIKL